MSNASEESLGALHGLLAESMKEALEKARNSDEGVPPQLMAQIIKFLKDNNIEAAPTEGGDSELDQLMGSLPEFEPISAQH